VTDFVHNTESGKQVVTNPNPYVAKKRNWVVPLPVQARLILKTAQDTNIAELHRPNILFVGQIARHKGIDLLIDAQRLLRQTHPSVVMGIAGQFQEEESAAKITNAVNENIGINYLGYRNDVLELMRSADIYVHPSPPSRFSESFGRGVVEAMSTGTPVVCFRSGALAEIVKHEESGLVCSEETAEELAATLRRFLDDANLRHRCGQSARAEFETKYSNSTVKARWMELLELNG
jgi:glycosyltransferase involved in cell wall biosynthesis